MPRSSLAAPCKVESGQGGAQHAPLINNRITMSPALLGFLRGLGFAVLTFILAYVGNAEHLAFLNPATASFISMLALSLEHYIEGRTGNALFGAVTSR